MIKRKSITLPDGRTLIFPENTSEDVIQQTIDRISEEAEEPEEPDLFGNAIEKQTETITQVNNAIANMTQKLVNSLVQSEKQINAVTLSRFEPVLKEISNHLGAAVRVEDEMIKTVKENTTVVRDMVKAQQDNNKILKDLVKTTGAKKKVLRDKEGNIIGVDIKG